MSEEIMNIGSAEGDQVLELDINRLRAFKNHPFKVTADMSMVELKDSIEKYGILVFQKKGFVFRSRFVGGVQGWNGYEFAYRTVREIKQYISAAYELSGQWADAEIYRAIDEQLLQKVLPKIHGNRKEIGTMLDELEAVCKQNGKELELSRRKIEQMKGKLAAVQYASFI